MKRPLPVGRLAVVAGLAVAVVAAVPSGAAPARASFGKGSPGFVVAAAPASLPNAAGAGEPSLGVSWKSGSAMYMAYTSTYKLRFNNRVNPPAVTWSDASSPYSAFNLDPILATDAASGTTLAGGDDGGCAVMSRTTDDGESWSPSLPCTGLIDHPTVGIGPGAGGVGTTAYFCQQYPVLNQCSRSLDGGSTWSPGVTLAHCIGLFGHVKVAPDGTAYIPSNGCSTGVGGFFSRDNGLTWNEWTVPGAAPPGRGFDPSVASTSDGALFESWTHAEDAHPMVAVSHDRAAHWDKAVDLAATVSPPLAGSSFPTMVAGSRGRAAVAFLGTRHVPPKGVSTYDDKDAIWDLYVSTTYDGGTTWTTRQVTTDPVQRGGIADGGTTSSGNRNLLDFMDAGVTRDGRVIVAFADGCTAHSHCLDDDAGPSKSTDSWATVAYQSSGRGLFAAYDR